MKIWFESDYDLALDKILSIQGMIISIRSGFQKDNEYYPEVYLHECECEILSEF